MIKRKNQQAQEGNRFNSGEFLKFLKQMIRYSRQKIFFITDHHPADTTKILNQWLSENKEKIEVFFMPPYSPELNAQEDLNQDVKTNIEGDKRPINKAQLKTNVQDFMKKRKKDKTAVKKYFPAKHLQYAAHEQKREYSINKLLIATNILERNKIIKH